MSIGGWPRRSHFDNVLIQVVSEASTRYQMVESGLADYATLIPYQLIEKLEKIQGLMFLIILHGQTNFIS